MEDFIVIILTLIIVIIGAVGKTKRKNIQQPADNQKAQPGNLWDFLNEFDENKVQQNREIIDEPVINQEIISEPKTPVYNFTAKNEGGSKMNRDNSKAEEKPEETKTFKKRPDESFSLRKAVIYNEILNRKYF